MENEQDAHREQQPIQPPPHQHQHEQHNDVVEQQEDAQVVDLREEDGGGANGNDDAEEEVEEEEIELDVVDLELLVEQAPPQVENEWPSEEEILEKVRNSDPFQTNLHVTQINRFETFERVGACLAPNKHVRCLTLALEQQQQEQQQEEDQQGRLRPPDLWNTACREIYKFLETSPTLCDFEVHGCFAYPDVVDNFLYHYASPGKHSHPPDYPESISVHNCLFSPEAVAYLLRHGQMKYLTLSPHRPMALHSSYWESARQALAENTFLTWLDISSYYDLPHLFVLPVENQSNISVIRFSGRDGPVPFDCRKSMTQFMERLRHLKQVMLDQPLSGDEFEPFATALSKSSCTTVSKLSLGNRVDARACAMLVNVLQATTSIGELNVFGGDCCSVFHSSLQGLWGNQSVHTAKFYGICNCNHANSRTFLQVNILQQLSQLVKLQHPTLKTLEVTSMDPSWASALFQALSENTTLTDLSAGLVQHFPLDDNVALDMKRCFEINKTLKKFTWESSVRSISALRMVLDSLKRVPVITSLSLLTSDLDGGNRLLGAQVYSLLPDWIQENKSLVEISLLIPCPASRAPALFRALELNRTLQKLTLYGFWSIDYNMVLDHVIQSLPRLLSLKHLDVEVLPSLILERKVEILQALSRNYSLETFQEEWDGHPDEISCATRFAEECKCYFNRNKNLQLFVVRPDNDPAGTPPGLLAPVLATLTQEPNTTSVRYEALRRNVHALGVYRPTR